MDAIKQYHPLVGFSFFMLMIVLSLVSMQPFFQVISFVAAVCYALVISGPASFLRGNWWLLLLIIIVVLFNSVFGGRGLTVLFVLDLGFMQSPITVESLVYGLCMGLMLANVILWFNILGKLSSVQGFIELFSKVSPTMGMMVARITVFIPELLAQAKLVEKAQRVFEPVSKPAQGAEPAPLVPTADQESVLVPVEDAAKRSRREQLSYAGALSSHLMEWGMEKSLVTAQSMMARGYGSRRRTSYRRTRLALRDLVPLGIILALGLTCLVCIIWASTTYQFYPYLSPFQPWWGYIPFLALCLIPLILQLGEELAWWRST